MLILDKQRAVEHMVALTAHPIQTEAETPGTVRGRRRQQIATFERRASAAPAAAGPRPAPRAATARAGGVSMA
jgi:hypothetical protein